MTINEIQEIQVRVGEILGQALCAGAKTAQERGKLLKANATLLREKYDGVFEWVESARTRHSTDQNDILLTYFSAYKTAFEIVAKRLTDMNELDEKGNPI